MGRYVTFLMKSNSSVNKVSKLYIQYRPNCAAEDFSFETKPLSSSNEIRAKGAWQARAAMARPVASTIGTATPTTLAVNS